MAEHLNREGGSAAPNSHACSFTIYSHTSYSADGEQRVMLCADRDCVAWAYAPPLPPAKDGCRTCHRPWTECVC